MSINWTKKEFAARIRTTTIRAGQIVEGDIVLEDGNPLGVDAVARLPGNRIEISDCDDNGFSCPRDRVLRIIAREALRAPR